MYLHNHSAAHGLMWETRERTWWANVMAQAEEGLSLPEIDGRAVRGLKFAEALPARLAEATPARPPALRTRRVPASPSQSRSGSPCFRPNPECRARSAQQGP